MHVSSMAEYRTNNAYRITWTKTTEMPTYTDTEVYGATLHLTLRNAEEFIDQFMETHWSRPGPNARLRPDFNPSKDTVPTVEVGSEAMMKLVAEGSIWET